MNDNLWQTKGKSDDIFGGRNPKLSQEMPTKVYSGGTSGGILVRQQKANALDWA